jgi:hypothetical protein
MRIVLISALLALLTACESGMDDDTAARLMQEASTLERSGQVVLAYRRYKLVEGYYSSDGEINKSAWDGAQRTRVQAEAMQYEIERALDSYKKEHGAYPKILKEVAPYISNRTFASLNSFSYGKREDGSATAWPIFITTSFSL